MALDPPEDIVPKTRAEIEIAAGLIGIRSGTIRQWFHRRRPSGFDGFTNLLGESRPEISPVMASDIVIALPMALALIPGDIDAKEGAKLHPW
jgi:hypothetical protein